MEWFSGSNILQNAKEIIREVLVPIPLFIKIPETAKN
jgi:hypothetical protein